MLAELVRTDPWDDVWPSRKTRSEQARGVAGSDVRLIATHSHAVALDDAARLSNPELVTLALQNVVPEVGFEPTRTSRSSGV